MDTPARIDINADRWVACIRYVSFFTDFTGANLGAQVRQVADAGGSPLIDLSLTTNSSAEGVKLFYAGSDTIANHIAAGRLEDVPAFKNPATGVSYALSDTVTLSWVRFRLNQTSMAGLPFPDEINQGERGDNVKLAWDFHATPAGGLEDKYAGGDFIVRAGVKQ